MKRVFAFFLSFLMITVPVVPLMCLDARAVGTSAQAYVLLDADTGIVLSEGNSNTRMKMASTTKIMTTLITLEHAQKENKVITFTEDMTAEGSSMYLGVGDKVRLTDLAAGMMMASGNDAANAAALSISDSFEAFAQLMNRRAKEIGMTNTNFVTPSGLDDEAHYSTAYDMALLMAEAMNNQSFAALTSCTEKTVEFVYPDDRVVTYANHNKLLRLYDGCVGGKTGYTQAAGRCLVTAAEKDGIRLIAVTLNAPDDWDDHISLYDYGFSLYTKVSFDDTDKIFNVKLAGGTNDFVSASTDEVVACRVPSERVEDIEKKIYLPDFIFAPVEKGDVLGSITYTLDGVLLTKAELKASETVSEKQQPSFWVRLFSAIFNRE